LCPAAGIHPSTDLLSRSEGRKGIMRVVVRFLCLLPIVVLVTPLLLAVAGCGSDVSTSEPSAELKKSEATYEEIIAKQQATSKKGGTAKTK
jgi:hypothetical protein